MPEGTFAIVTSEKRRPRAKKEKPLNEEQLIALCRDLVEEDKAWDALYDRWGDVFSGDWPATVVNEDKRLREIVLPAYQKIAATPAHTLVGLKAKAEAIMKYSGEADEDRIAEWSVLLDIVHRIGESHPSMPTAADREIIRLVDEFKKQAADETGLSAILEAYPASDAKAIAAEKKIRRMVKRGWKIRLRVSELEATTPEALAAKAWLAVWETCDGDIDAEPTCDTKRVPWSLAKDVLRALAVGLPIASEAAPTDAELIKLCEEWQEKNYEYWMLNDEANRLSGVEVSGEQSRRVDLLDAKREKVNAFLDGGIREKILETKATTPRGAHAKALVIQGLVQGQQDFCIDDDTLHMIGGLARDLRDMAGVPSVASAAEADASLIKICADHIANFKAFNDYDGPLDCNNNPLWHRYEATLDAISTARATSLPGLIAKARAIKVEARTPDGEDIYEEVAHWMWGVINDLVQIGETAAVDTVPSISEIARLALEMGRLDREADDADNLHTDEGDSLCSSLDSQLDKTAKSIMELSPETPEDVMGKLIATIGTVDAMTARLNDVQVDRQLGAAVRGSLEDCIIALSKATGRSIVDMGGDYFMGRRLREIAQ